MWLYVLANDQESNTTQVNYQSSQLSLKSITTQVIIYMPIILVVNFTVTDLMAMDHRGGSGKDPVKKVTNTSGQGY